MTIKILNFSFFFLITIFSIPSQAARIFIPELGEEIETQELFFSEVLSHWIATDDRKAQRQMEMAIDQGNLRQPSEIFVAPLQLVPDPQDASGGFFQYLRAKESVIGGERNPDFHAWYMNWFREIHKLGPQYRARSLAFEALDNANRKVLEAYRDPSVLVLAQQYRDRFQRFSQAAQDPQITFQNLHDIMIDLPSLTPQADDIARRSETWRIVEVSLKNAGRLASKATRLQIQGYLDIAGEYNRIAAKATEIARSPRVTPADLFGLNQDGAALHAQVLRLERIEAEVFSEESLGSDESDSSCESDENDRKRERDDADEPAAAPRSLTIRIRLTPEISQAIAQASKNGDGQQPK